MPDQTRPGDLYTGEERPTPEVGAHPIPLRVTLEEARTAPIPAGRQSSLLIAHGTMEVRYYAPSGIDQQTPHEQDELYVVARGMGWFVCAEQRTPFGPGDVLFVPAGAHHRFEDFDADFGVWVIFYGPDGGEQPRNEIG